MTEQLLDNLGDEELSSEEHEQLLLISEHAIAPPLSPAARAVFQAFNSKFEWIEDGVPGPQFNAIAAALRAAADEVCLRWAELEHPADVLTRIATEFEGLS